MKKERFNPIHMFLGLIYAAVGLSMFCNLYNFFDIRAPLPQGLPIKWGLWLAVPPLVISVLDKLRVIFFPKEHEDILKDQLISINNLFAETIAWAIPNAIGGVLWGVVFFLAHPLLLWLQDIHYLTEVAEFMGLVVPFIKY